MFERIRAKIKGILEDGEFVDEDETDILEMSFAYMRLLRISPQRGKKLTAFDFLVSCTVAFPFIVIAGIAYAINQYFYEDYVILDDMFLVVTGFVTLSNMYSTMGIFIYKHEDIVRLATSIGCFRKFRKPASFDRTNRLANLLTKFMTYYSFIGALVYAMLSFYQRPKCLKENAEWKVERICGLIMPAYLPMYFNEPPYLYLVILVQTWNIAVMCTTSSVLLTFVAVMAVLIKTRIRLFKEDVRDAFACATPEGRRSRLKECVRYHVYLMNAVYQLNDCVRGVCFVQSSMVCVVMALVAYQFLLQPELKTMVHGLGWLFAMSIFCFGGQALIDESDDLSVAMFHADWFEADVETQKMLALMIGQGHYILYLDTTFFGPLSLQTLSSILQKAYSIIAILYD